MKAKVFDSYDILGSGHVKEVFSTGTSMEIIENLFDLFMGEEMME